MASVFGHALVAFTTGKVVGKPINTIKPLMIGIICSMMPDADVIGFHFGVPYHDMFGHRGITHSLFFGFCFGVLVAFLFHYQQPTKRRFQYATFYAFCTMSHGVIDGFTTGGMGIAYFAPFLENRYFMPMRKILVSPLGIENFFSNWGLRVLYSEALFIGLPCVLMLVAKKAWIALKT